MNDLSGYMIYSLLLNKEAVRLGIIKAEDYKCYISNVIDTLNTMTPNLGKDVIFGEERNNDSGADMGCDTECKNGNTK